VTDRYLTRSATPTVATPVDFDVTLNKASTSTVTVSYASASGTAVAGSDYAAFRRRRCPSRPARPGRPHVQSFGTALPRPTGNFRLVLSSPAGATLADPTGYGYFVAAQEPPQVTVLAASAAEGRHRNRDDELLHPAERTDRHGGDRELLDDERNRDRRHRLPNRRGHRDHPGRQHHSSSARHRTEQQHRAAEPDGLGVRRTPAICSAPRCRDFG